MNKFETVILLSPEIQVNSIKQELEKFKKYISDNSGKIISQEDWGLRDLSYSISKFNKAFYNYFQIEMDSIYLDKIKKDLNQTDNILRYLFIKVKDHQTLPTKLVNEKK